MNEEYNNLQTIIHNIADMRNTPVGVEVHRLEKEITTLEEEIARKRKKISEISTEYTADVDKVKKFVRRKAKEILKESVDMYCSKDGIDDFWNKYGKYLVGERYESIGTESVSRLETYFYSVEDCDVYEKDGNVMARITFIEAQGSTDCPDEIFWDMKIPIENLIEMSFPLEKEEKE